MAYIIIGILGVVSLVGCSPYNILDISSLKNTTIKVNYTNLENKVCIQGANCTLDNILIDNDSIIYEDLRFASNVLRIQGASNTPEYVSFVGNTYELAFDPTTMEQAFLTAQFPHSRRSNSTIMPHFHWSGITDSVGYVTWCMEYVCSNVEDIFSTSTDTRCINDTFENPYQHHMTPMINIENNYTESAVCSIRVYRDATADTYSGDALLLEFDIHYSIGKLGEVYEE